jgi:2-dehydro-3-deoxyphosphogluconate aldolase/(4S)-4-hydroxy-2-oxoglutarate aldolase
MVHKFELLNKIADLGLVAIVRSEGPDQALDIAEAVLEGGCSAVEITFTVPGAQKVIETLASRHGPDELILGAGTVLDPETARIALLSGARFIVSPHLNVDTVRLCHRYQAPVMPGAMSVQEVVTAMEAGADIVKLFPGELFGAQFIRSIRGPLPQAPLMPTGGVDLSNVAEMFAAGAVAVGVGGSLTAGAKTGDFKAVTHAAEALLKRIREARSA